MPSELIRPGVDPRVVLPMTRAMLDALPAGSRDRVVAAWAAALDSWPSNPNLDRLLDSIKSGAAETIDTAWKTVMGDEPLSEELRQLAAALLTKGGGQGDPSMFVIYGLHPFLVLAVVLRVEGDPRARIFYVAYKGAKADTAAFGPVLGATYESGGRAFNDVNAMLAAQQRLIRRGGLRPRLRRSLVKTRPREHRSRATGSRAPPEDDDAEIERARPRAGLSAWSRV